MQKVEVNEILDAVKKLKKKLPIKCLRLASTEEEKEKLDKNWDVLMQINDILFAMYDIESAYDFLKRYPYDDLAEEVEAVFDCMKKLYFRLGEAIKNVQ